MIMMMSIVVVLTMIIIMIICINDEMIVDHCICDDYLIC